MYNAMASFESQGSKGSTRLHMDMADAVNIMTYASSAPDGRPGCAAWDIFKAEDTQKLRKFLRKKFKGQYQHDPIHSQQFYLDASLRQELYKEHGVMSHRIYQKPGEAVFIPAGCAHQVRNIPFPLARLAIVFCLARVFGVCGLADVFWLVCLFVCRDRCATSRTASRSRATSSAPRTSSAARRSRASSASRTSRWRGRKTYSSCAR